jgi:hypothetical protein
MARKPKNKISTRKAEPASSDETKVVDEHIGRLSVLKDRRSLFDTLQEDVAKHVIPFRQDWTPDVQQGQKHGTHIWDGTPQGAVNIFTNGMYGNVVSPALPWFMIQSSDDLLNDIASVKAWAQEATKAVSRALYRSNFYREMLPFIADWGTIGTATLYSELDEATQRIAFNAIHPKQIYIATDRFGFVDTVFREYKISLRNAVDQFGLESLSETHKNMYEDDKFKEIKILHAVYPRVDYDHTRKDVQNKPFASVWIDIENNRVFRISGFDEFPYAVGRYAVNTGEDYGRSPAMESLPDIKGLHKIGKDLLQASDMHVNPMYNVPVDQKGQVRIGSKKINYFTDPQRVVHRAGVEGNYFVGVDREQRKQENVREAFHVNFFLMLQNAERGMTATEILERQSEKAIVLAPAVGRLTFEVLDKIISRTFNIEFEAGRIPPPPTAITENQNEVEVTYLGPLAQVQARLFENRGLINGLEVIAPLIKIWPEIRDNYNPDEIADVVSDSYNMPQKVRRSVEEILTLRRSQAQAAQAAQEQAAAESTARALKDAGAANEKFDGAFQESAEDLVV